MSSVDHLHVEAEILKVKEHSELLSTQYLAMMSGTRICLSLLSPQGKPLRDG